MKHMIVGFVAIIFGLWGLVTWWTTFALVLKGFIPFGLLIIGLVALLSGYRRLVMSDQELEEEVPEEPKRKRTAQSKG